MKTTRWVAAALVLCVLGCSRPRPNLLLITFDTTRADHVGYATDRANRTPTLDALAARGTWFATCIASQPLTVPSHASIMTGLYPYHHGVRNNGTYSLGEEATTLAELAREAGYATHAIVSSFVLDSQFGLDQGFDGYDDDLAGAAKPAAFMFREIKAERTAAKAVRWIKEERPKDRPFFLWVHFWDPHADYDPPRDVAIRFPGDPYSGEIYFADRELGNVIAALGDRQLDDRTLVVFVGDHGEGLGEHGERTHGIFIYDATVHVPMLFAGPGVPVARRVDGLVRTVDIVPTLIELLRLRNPGTLDGASLRPLWRGGQDERWAYSETFITRFNFGWSELRGIRTATWKAIQAPRPEVYDLTADPRERTNLLAGGARVPEAVLPLFNDLRRTAAEDPFARGGQREAKLDPETRRKLAALGYVWGSDTGREGPRADPKDRIAFWDRFERAQALIRQRAYAEAIPALDALLAEDPENAVALLSLANALSHTGDRQRALETLQRVIALDPTREQPYLAAAKLLRELGRRDEALQLVQAVVAMQPESPEILLSLGDAYLEDERFAEAEGWFRKAVAADPHSMTAAAGLGNCLNRAGRLTEALEVLRAAREHDPSHHTVTYNLAVVLERLGDQRGALELYRVAVQLDPDDSMSWNNLGSILDRMGQREEALRHIARARELDPENAEAAYNLGALYVAAGKAAQGLPHLEAALALRPSFLQAAVFRARALEALQQWPAALSAYRELSKSNPAALLGVARVELAMGHGEAARAALAAAIERGGDGVRTVAQRDPALGLLLRERRPS